MADGTFVVGPASHRTVVVLGAEPLVAGTGPPGCPALFELVAPDELRWVFLSNECDDHAGNVLGLLAACPRATVVTTWLTEQRLAERGVVVPRRRLHLLDDGDVLDTGDRAFAVERPPLHARPTTVGLLDTSTAVFWTADAWSASLHGAPVLLDDAHAAAWREAFVRFHHWNCPWVHNFDPAWWGRAVDRVEQRRLDAIVPAFGPVLRGEHVAMAIDAMRDLPSLPPTPIPS